MKVLAIVKFYFAHQLPRAPDWDGTRIEIVNGRSRAIVAPRGSQEALFPDDIDRTLQSVSFEMSPVGGEGRLKLGMHGALDRISIYVIRELPDLDPSHTKLLDDEFVTDAIDACNHFLELCRAEGRVPFLESVRLDITKEGGKFVLTPHTVSWFDADTNARLPFYPTPDGVNVNARLSPGAMRSPVRDAVPMSQILASARAGKSPLVNSLLADAHEWLVTLRVREAVVALGSACEIASHAYVARKGIAEDANIKKILHSKQSFAVKRFDAVPLHVQGRSLKAEKPTVFADLERAYRTRNSVVHAGALSYDDQGRPQSVDQRRAFEFLRSCIEAVDWLNSL